MFCEVRTQTVGKTLVFRQSQALPSGASLFAPFVRLFCLCLLLHSHDADAAAVLGVLVVVAGDAVCVEVVPQLGEREQAVASRVPVAVYRAVVRKTASCRRPWTTPSCVLRCPGS